MRVISQVIAILVSAQSVAAQTPAGRPVLVQDLCVDVAPVDMQITTTAVAASGDVLFIAGNPRDGAPSLLRLDPRTGEILRRVRFGIDS